MRKQRVGGDKGGFDLATQRRVKYDFSRCEVGLCREQALLHSRR